MSIHLDLDPRSNTHIVFASQKKKANELERADTVNFNEQWQALHRVGNHVCHHSRNVLLIRSNEPMEQYEIHMENIQE
jgi:hypothetical protein